MPADHPGQRVMPGSPPELGVWLATGSFFAAEIAIQSGFQLILLESEHGSINDSELNQLIPFLKSLGARVLVKVRDAGRAAVQRPLDFGADGIVIPHVEGIESATLLTGYAKYPPVGSRSLAGERAAEYLGITAEWIRAQDVKTSCIAMVETASALEDIEQIVALPTVNGIMPGPSDLSVRRGRTHYGRTADDFADLERIARACEAAGKPWLLPAWTADERSFARKFGASAMFVASEYVALRAGYQAALTGSDLE